MKPDEMIFSHFIEITCNLYVMNDVIYVAAIVVISINAIFATILLTLNNTLN